MKKIAIALLCVFAAPLAHADDGTWRFTVGAHNVDPTSDNGSLAAGALDVDVGSNWRPSFTAEYFLNDHLGVEVLAALPFKHDVKLNGVAAGEVTHLPPTVSLQYHFSPEAKISPYLGAGVNFTWIYSEDSAGPIAGTELKLKNSWGLAAHAGVDFKLENDWFVGVDARWIDIDSDVSVNTVQVGTVNIDPLVYGVYVGKRF
ncbi:MAG: OmpW family protein [Xanthomonadales bacterium]|jgi:outer membrane protein|nr:OmpW family protein [Xanthomonadales bacterium]MBP7624060.1 OmpW family protein [Xanthomonadales bacterium]